MDRRDIRIVGMVLLVPVLGCSRHDDSGGGPSGDDVGRGRLALAAIPPDVACVQIVAAGSRTVTRLFGVSGGQPAAFMMEGLPLGAVGFSGAAFASPCDLVRDSLPGWSSDVVTTLLERDRIAQVMLTLRRPGRA